jgi:hypothetical protein
MPSQRYNLLQRQVAKLERALLPPAQQLADLSVDLTKIDGIENRVAAFVVLCHAELESYLEDRSRAIAERGQFQWLRKKRHSPCVFSLLAYYADSELPDALPVVGDADYDRADLTPLLRNAVDRHITRINSNNGIKTKDVLALVLPIGLRVGFIPHAAIAELDAYGAQRGAIAHQHQSHRVRASLNARDEKQRADRVLVELAAMDTELSKLSV